MSMVSIDMIRNAPASGEGTCEDFGLCGLGAVAVDTGGKWKWKGGKSGQFDDYGRLYGSPVNPPPAPPSPYYPPYYPPAVYPGFAPSPINWASAWPFYRSQTPASAFSPLWQPPYNPMNTDTIVPTTGPAASSYFASQFISSPPGTPAFALDFRADVDDFDSGMEGLAGPAEDLDMQAAMLEATPGGQAAAAQLRQQAAAYRAQQAAAGSGGGPSSQDVANIVQGAGAAAASILKAFQEGRVAVSQAKTASGINLTPAPSPVFIPTPSPSSSIPGWAWGVGAAALGLVVVMAAKG